MTVASSTRQRRDLLVRQGEEESRLRCWSDEVVDSKVGVLHTLALGVSGTRLALAPVVALTVAALAVTVVVAVADILHLAVTVNGAPGPVAVAAVVVALAVLAGRAAAVTARGDAAAAGRTVAARGNTAVIAARAAVATVAAALTTGAVTAGVEAP